MHVYYISAKLCLYEVVHVMPVTWHIAKLIYRQTHMHLTDTTHTIQYVAYAFKVIVQWIIIYLELCHHHYNQLLSIFITPKRNFGSSISRSPSTPLLP